jgi:hypothetical protein
MGHTSALLGLLLRRRLLLPERVGADHSGAARRGAGRRAGAGGEQGGAADGGNGGEESGHFAQLWMSEYGILRKFSCSVLNVYTCGREAARRNGCGVQSMLARCHSVE